MTEDIVKRLWRMADMTSADNDLSDITTAANYIVELKNEIQQLKKQKRAVYTERNRLVAFIASMFPSGIKETDIPGWDKEWHGCVYIDLPNGQASWHYHESQANMFAHLPRYEGEWDGHTTEEKYNRIAALELRSYFGEAND